VQEEKASIIFDAAHSVLYKFEIDKLYPDYVDEKPPKCNSIVSPNHIVSDSRTQPRPR
jgi:hypothetical protein